MPRPLPGLARPIFAAYFREVAVAVVMVDQRADGSKRVRMAVGTKALPMLAAVDIAKIPIEVAEHHQIQLAVVVQVHPGGARRPATTGDARLRVTSVNVPSPLL